MFRRYNRWQSRFDQPDPYDGGYDSTDPQSFNRYAYVQNDPVNFVDPTGLEFCLPFIGCIGITVIKTFTVAPHWTGSGGGGAGGIFGDDFNFEIELGNPEVGGGTSGGSGENPQNPAPNVDDLGRRITNIVNNSKCADFIKNLINKAAELTGNPAASNSALDLFSAIKGQGGFVYGDTIKRAYGFDGATVHGSISGGNAQVEFPFPTPFRFLWSS